jgi:hypothetical protein
MSAKRYDVVVARDYVVNGEKRTEFVRVGVGFQLTNRKDGIGIELYSPSQKLLILPIKERSAEPGDAKEDEKKGTR